MQDNGEEILMRCLTGVVSIPNSSDYLEDPIEGKDVLGMHWLFGESGIASALVGPRVLAMWNIYIVAVLHLTQVQPDTG